MGADSSDEEVWFVFMNNLILTERLRDRINDSYDLGGIKRVEYGLVLDFFEMLRICESENYARAHELNREVKSLCSRAVLSPEVRLGDKTNFYELNRRALLFDALDDLDSYFQFMEYNREPEDRFYLPRRRIIKPIIDALQQIEDDELDLLSISQPPGTGKTTIGVFFLTWVMGKYPLQPNLASAHSDKLTRSFYDRVLNIIEDPDYAWGEVFPGLRIVRRNANDETVDLEKVSDFATLTCRSIDGSLTGATRCEKYLYADDLVSGIEEALSINRMDSLWHKYTNDLKTRKKQNCKEIHIATRWSVHDPIGRLEAQYGENPRAKFLSLPALDENDESNFDYQYDVGFNTQYFLDMRANLDDVSWRALFQNEPIEREGLLFPTDDLNYYNGILPGGEPDKIVAFCDVAWGGGDSLSMPFAYVYGEDAYIHDVIFNRSDKEITRPIVMGKIMEHMPHQARFEANNGGDEYCDAVDKLLREKGVKLNLSHRKAPGNTNKIARIIQKSVEIKNMYFRDSKNSSVEYRAFMRELTTFVTTGKNKHDDAPDSLAGLVLLIEGDGGSVKVFKRPI